MLISVIYCLTAWAPDVDILPELSESQEDDENQEEEFVFDSSPERTTSFHYSTSPHGHRAGLSHLNSAPSNRAINLKKITNDNKYI